MFSINLVLFLLIFVHHSICTTTEEEEAKALAEVETNIQALKRELSVLQSFVKLVKASESCDDFYSQGVKDDGIYELKINGKTLKVYCEFKKNNTEHNWLVLQRRFNGKVEFYRTWNDYIHGFGNKSEEFWLGLKNISYLTTSHPYLLRVDIADFKGNETYADYSIFMVMNETSNYKLKVGGYTGSACDALSYHNGMPFTTFDRDNDQVSTMNCANHNHGGWWYRSCFRANLNGRYFSEGGRDFSGIIWFEWGDIPIPKKAIQMKIRPI